MATTYTANARLQKPGAADRGWDVPLNANADMIDAMTALGSLAVTTSEFPSSSLNVRVTAGSYALANGTVGNFVGVGSVSVPNNATTCLWLTDGGVVTQGSAFPTTAHVRLAQVVAGAATISAVVDQRIQCATRGSGLGFFLKSGDSMSGPLSIVSPSTGAAMLAIDPTARTLGFFGVVPNTQALSLAALIDSTTGTAGTGVTNCGSSFSQATLNNNFATLAAQVNALIAAMKRHGLMSS